MNVNYAALHSSDSEEEELQKAYDRCVGSLKTRVSYCFLNYKNDPLAHWSVATWSLRTRHSSIRKFGTQSDKAQLAQETKRNQSRPFRSRKRPIAPNPRYHVRQVRRQGTTTTMPSASTQRASSESQPPPVQGQGKVYGYCQITGCSFPELECNHKCHRCRNDVHNLCAQKMSLCDIDNELDMYCSALCSKEGPML